MYFFLGCFWTTLSIRCFVRGVPCEGLFGVLSGIIWCFLSGVKSLFYCFLRGVGVYLVFLHAPPPINTVPRKTLPSFVPGSIHLSTPSCRSHDGMKASAGLKRCFKIKEKS